MNGQKVSRSGVTDLELSPLVPSWKGSIWRDYEWTWKASANFTEDNDAQNSRSG